MCSPENKQQHRDNTGSTLAALTTICGSIVTLPLLVSQSATSTTATELRSMAAESHLPPLLSDHARRTNAPDASCSRPAAFCQALQSHTSPLAHWLAHAMQKPRSCLPFGQRCLPLRRHPHPAPYLGTQCLFSQLLSYLLS